MVSSACKFCILALSRNTLLILEPRTYAIAAAIGPLVGGGLAEAGQWRWLFCERKICPV